MSAPEQPVAARRDQDSLPTDVTAAWLLLAILRERRMILSCVLAGGAIALLFALLRAPNYTATFSFVPQQSGDGARTGLSSLAGQFGLSIGSGTAPGSSPQFYADLLTTQAVLLPVAVDSYPIAGSSATRTSLSEFFSIKDPSSAVVVDKTIRRLRAEVISSTVALRTTGVVTVQVQTKSPYASLAIAERLLGELDRFNRSTRQSQGAAERRFVEGLAATARDSLRAAEDALQRFLQRNRQVGDFSQASFDRSRLERDVAMHQQLATRLMEQLDEARIREVRDTPAITVIEPPSLPVRADSRERLLTLVSGTSIALLLALSLALTRQGLRRAPIRDTVTSELLAEWHQLRANPLRRP